MVSEWDHVKRGHRRYVVLRAYYVANAANFHELGDRMPLPLAWKISHFHCSRNYTNRYTSFSSRVEPLALYFSPRRKSCDRCPGIVCHRNLVQMVKAISLKYLQFHWSTLREFIRSWNLHHNCVGIHRQNISLQLRYIYIFLHIIKNPIILLENS